MHGEMLQGTLDLLILRTLVIGPAHGHTIAHAIEHQSDEVLQVEHGSLYPALHRLEDRGWIASFWGTSENNRRARYYRLTPRGRQQLETPTTAGTSWFAPSTASCGRPTDTTRMGWIRFFRRRAWDAERARELQAYLDQEIDDTLARGMSRDAAVRAAHLRLGNVSIREDIYDMNTIALLESAWRTCATAPGCSGAT